MPLILLNDYFFILKTLLTRENKILTKSVHSFTDDASVNMSCTATLWWQTKYPVDIK